MEYYVHFSKHAKMDIRHTIDYIDNVLKNPTAASRLLTKIESGAASLALMPQRCALADDPVLTAWEIRYLIIENYLLFIKLMKPPIPFISYVFFMRKVTGRTS